MPQFIKTYFFHCLILAFSVRLLYLPDWISFACLSGALIIFGFESYLSSKLISSSSVKANEQQAQIDLMNTNLGKLTQKVSDMHTSVAFNPQRNGRG